MREEDDGAVEEEIKRNSIIITTQHLITSTVRLCSLARLLVLKHIDGDFTINYNHQLLV
jgi:hypothetical protein